MAEKTLAQLQAEYAKITEENRKAYDALKQPSSLGEKHPGQSLEDYYLNLKQAYDKPGVGNKAEIAKKIAAVEGEFKKAQAEYKRTQEEKNVAKKALDAAKKLDTSESKSGSAKKSAQTEYDKALTALKNADTKLSGYKGEQGYIVAYKELQKAADALTKAGGTATLPTPKVAIPEGTVDSKGNVVENAPTKLRDYASEIGTAGKAIAKMDGPGRLALSTALANAGYKVKPSANYSDDLISAYTQAIAENQIRSTNFNKEIPLQEFLALRKSEGVGAGVGTGGGPSTSLYPTITNKESGKATINKFFQDKFGRDATPEEFEAAYAAVIADQKKNPEKVVTKKDSAGRTVYERSGGTNTEQFLTDYVSKKPKLKQELDTYEASDAKVLQRSKDKKLYEAELAKLGGDVNAIAKLNQSTPYGRAIQSMQNKIARLAIDAGAKFSDAELAQIAKEAIDTSLDTDTESLTAFINSKFKFGKNAEGRYIGAAGQNFDTLAKVANANGIDLEKVFGTQLPDWLNSINKGESVDTYKKIIRDVAKIGMPEKVAKLIDQGVDLSAIYAPYKNLMATTLEINPQTIDLNDPTLRSAITSQNEIPLYDFERSLRKDDRWQYTDAARSEVSSATQKILQDFGFMG